MNNAIINNWNKRVNSEDIVYILGDFAANNIVAEDIVQKLNGHKNLILGNHDNCLSNKTLSKFIYVDKLITIQDSDRSVCLCHYPLMSFENSIYGGYHIFGHIHNNPNDIASKVEKHMKNIFNCGVDVIGFTPRTLDELIELNRGKYDL